MRRARLSRGPVGWFSSAALVAVLGFAPAAEAVSSPAGGSDLSRRLLELSKPSVRSAAPADQAERLGLAPAGAGSLLRQDDRVLAYVRFDREALAGVDALRVAGARIVDVSSRYQTVTVAARPADLVDVAAVEGVAGVTEALAPLTAATCPSGDVVSEGLAQLHAGDGTGEARDVFSVDGGGIEVGILSDSFDQATEAVNGSPIATTAPQDVANADLPGGGNPCAHTTPVAVLEGEESTGGEGPTDEGRAMAQIVHDLAPGASLSFASAFNGETSFAKNIKALASAGADVIADDVFYLEEPFFQDGPVAVAVDEVVGAGVSYLSAAGNENLIDAEGHEIASWEAPAYRDAGGCPPAVQSLPGFNGSHCLDFDPGASVDRTLGIKVPAGEALSVDLQWSEPWNGVETDLDAFLLDFVGAWVAGSVDDNIAISQKPVEILQWANESASQQTVQIVVNRYAGQSPRLKLALLGDVSASEYPRSTGEDVVGPTVFGHSGAASALAVGAVRFDDGSEPERYSSRGPARHDFGPVKGVKAADPLPSAEIVSKPDLVATDCGRTTFFASFVGGIWRFCGTSAAAPHAAAVAALMLDEGPGAEPSEIRTALQSSATAVGAFGPCAIGAGLVEAVGAVEDLLAPPSFTPPTCLPPVPEGSVEEARAPGNWGSETPPVPPITEIEEGIIAANPPADANSSVSDRAPRTFIRSHPARLIRTRARTARTVFRFASDKAGVSFVCRIDGGLFRLCPQRLVRRFGAGWHTVRVVARDEAGNSDRTPASFRFQVLQVG